MKRANLFTVLRMFYPYLRRVPLSFLLFSYHLFKNERPHWFNGQIRINSFFPPYPSPSFDRFLNILINRQRIPHTVYLAVTSSCPYKCPHCSYGGRKHMDLMTQQMLQLIKDIKRLGTAILGITGGEPMLRTDLEELVTAAGPEMTTIIFTTGYNLNEARAHRLREAGVGCITIGFESADPKIQDNVRGKKRSLELGIEAIKTCKKAGIYTAIGTIGTRERIQNEELQRLYNLGRDLDVGEIRLIPPAATGNWAGHTEEMLGKEELEQLKQFHISHNRQKKGPIVASLAYLESAEVMGCNAGFQYLYIDAAGEVCPCDLTPLSFGNAVQQPLANIWKKMEKYFPRTRLTCLMGEIASEIQGTSFPLPPDQSKKIIPTIDKDTPLPRVYEKIKK